MSVDQTSLERIRNATFPVARRGYEKKEVEKFLARLADWLETGGGDQSRSDAVKKELERVGQRTGAILAQAEESAQQLRDEADAEAKQTITDANSAAEKTRSEADAYSQETRTAADDYSTETRTNADDYSTETRADADAYAADTRKTVDEEAAQARRELEQEMREGQAKAQATAERIVAEGVQRRRDIEAVISDLVRRRDTVIAQIEMLGGELSDAVAEHRPEPGEDPFDEPEDLDPAERDGELVDLNGQVDLDDEEGLDEDPEATEPVEDAPKSRRRRSSGAKAQS